MRLPGPINPAIPTALKLAYLAWICVWIPVYWLYNGPQNFLWLCDTVNILLLFGLWLESPLLISALATGVLLVQCVWILDVGSTAVGWRLIGGTDYMFDAGRPLWLRAMSLFHVAVPVLLIWSIRRLGYHPQGWQLQTAFCWLLLPATYLVADPELNINWLATPFGVRDHGIPGPALLGGMMLLYPAVLFYPTHLLLQRLFRSQLVSTTR